MSDLCAPVYVVMGSDEELTFWCFVEVMNRMVIVLQSTMDTYIHDASFRNKIFSETKVG